jgi:magnesium-transporting ATPase (P-type)
MKSNTEKSAANTLPPKPAGAKAPDIASASVPNTLAELKVNPDTGLTGAEVDTLRKENGYNEVAEKKGHPVLKFLKKFWGISAWMLELIMVLSAVLKNYSDLIVVGALLVINSVLGFMQEHRAAGVVAALRKRLQVNARVHRDSNWKVIPARELVPGDIVRVRPGDIIPADVKLLTGAMNVDQSALTGESKDADKKPGEVLSSGSIVRRGEGNGVVMLTGAKTYFGRTTQLVQEAHPKLHIEAVVAKVVRWLFVIVGALLTDRPNPPPLMLRKKSGQPRNCNRSSKNQKTNMPMAAQNISKTTNTIETRDNFEGICFRMIFLSELTSKMPINKKGASKPLMMAVQ